MRTEARDSDFWRHVVSGLRRCVSFYGILTGCLMTAFC